MSAQPMRHRFTADEYERLGAAGFFGEDDRVELIQGEIDADRGSSPLSITEIPQLTAGVGAR